MVAEAHYFAIAVFRQPYASLIMDRRVSSESCAVSLIQRWLGEWCWFTSISGVRVFISFSHLKTAWVTLKTIPFCRPIRLRVCTCVNSSGGRGQ